MTNIIPLWLAMAALPSLSVAHEVQGLVASISSERQVEDDIAAGLNAYRASQGLPPVPRSRALDRVAQIHAADLAANHPDNGTDARGLPCNAHSWSSRGAWTPVCYTADHHYAAAMWSKPRELTGNAYPFPGYEIAHWTSAAQASAPIAIAGWQRSSAHNAVILQQERWAQPWRAMGVGVSGGYAVVWFGRDPDPAAR